MRMRYMLWQCSNRVRDSDDFDAQDLEKFLKGSELIEQLKRKKLRKCRKGDYKRRPTVTQEQIGKATEKNVTAF